MPPTAGNAAFEAKGNLVKGSGAEADAATVPAGKSGKYTWQQVAAHNTAESCWVTVDGKVYDITGFLDKHPGGKEMLLLAAGRECTDLFNSYHWMRPDRPRKFLAAYEIGSVVGPTEFPLFAPDSTNFYGVMATRVREYFETTKLNPKDPFPGLWRTAVQIPIGLTCFAISVGYLLPELPFLVKCLAAAIYGIFQVMPLLHAMHDASHTSIGGSEGWWKFMGRLTLDWYAGCSMLSWHHQHIVGHHVYTNVFLADPDLPYRTEGDMRKIVSEQLWRSMYQFQWIYLPILYGFLAFKVRLTDITDTWLARTSGPIRVNFYDSVLVRVFITKGFWAFWRIYLPLYVLNVPTASFWALFMISEVMSGLWLAWNFEVSHLAPDALFPTAKSADLTSTQNPMSVVASVVPSTPSNKNKGKAVTRETISEDPSSPKNAAASSSAAKQQYVIPKSWAVVQAESSVDYGHNSWWTAWWCGALNYQIEHHLFPGISQYHYPAIAGIVKQTCKEFGVRYNYENTFADAWTSHVRLLYDMGKKGMKYHWD